jgi:ankyrin repeat protein
MEQRTSKKADARLFFAVQVGAEAKEMRDLLKPKLPWSTAANVSARHSLPASSYNDATPLHIAVSTGNLPVVMELSECGADVNARTTLGWVPLQEMLAA